VTLRFAQHVRDTLPNDSVVGVTVASIDKTIASTRAVFSDSITACVSQPARRGPRAHDHTNICTGRSNVLGRLLAAPLRSFGMQVVAVIVWCRRFRSVFLSVPIAEASRELRGTRDTTPASCRCCIAGRRGTRYGRRGRFRREVGSSG